MSGSPTTRIGDVLPALAALATAAVAPLITADEPIAVMDGPQLGEQPWQLVILGVTDSPDIAPYTTRYEQQDGLGTPRYVEVSAVRCLVSVARGDDDLVAARDRVVAIVAALDTALRAAHHLAGVWDDAGFGPDAWQWYPAPTPTGATVAVFFSLEVQALL